MRKWIWKFEKVEMEIKMGIEIEKVENINWNWEWKFEKVEGELKMRIEIE